MAIMNVFFAEDVPAGGISNLDDWIYTNRPGLWENSTILIANENVFEGSEYPEEVVEWVRKRPTYNKEHPTVFILKR